MADPFFAIWDDDWARTFWTTLGTPVGRGYGSIPDDFRRAAERLEKLNQRNRLAHSGTLDAPDVDYAARYNELQKRYDVLLDLVNEELLNERYRSLFLGVRTRERWRLVTRSDEPQPVREYVRLLGAISDLYTVFVSLHVDTYFVVHWIQNKPIQFSEADELRLVSISRASPDDARFEGLGAGLKAIGDALSVGKQYQEIKTAQEVVKQSKLETRMRQLDMEEAERQARISNASESEQTKVIVAQKRADLQAAETREAQEEFKLRQLYRQDLDEQLDLLTKHWPILKELPEDMKSRVIAQITPPVAAIRSTPFEIVGYNKTQGDELAAAPPTSDKAPDHTNPPPAA